MTYLVKVKDLHGGLENGSQVVFELFDALSFLSPFHLLSCIPSSLVLSF